MTLADCRARPRCQAQGTIDCRTHGPSQPQLRPPFGQIAGATALLVDDPRKVKYQCAQDADNVAQFHVITSRSRPVEDARLFACTNSKWTKWCTIDTGRVTGIRSVRGLRKLNVPTNLPRFALGQWDDVVASERRLSSTVWPESQTIARQDSTAILALAARRPASADGIGTSAAAPTLEGGGRSRQAIEEKGQGTFGRRREGGGTGSSESG